MPTAPETLRILKLCMGSHPQLVDELAVALEFELVDNEAPTVVMPGTQSQAPVVGPPAPVVAPRAALDAVVYAAAEERDVLPRHLRAFAVELLLRVEALGIGNREAAGLIAGRERAREAGEKEG